MPIQKHSSFNVIREICPTCKGCAYLELNDDATHFVCTLKDNERITKDFMNCKEFVEGGDVDIDFGLNNRQKQFCEEYIIDLNGSQAAKRSGYSEKSVGSLATTLLQNTKVQNYISHLQKKRNEIVQIDQRSVLLMLKEYVLQDLTRFIGLTADEIKSLPPDVKRMITGFKVSRKVMNKRGDISLVSESIELKFVDKGSVIEMINRHIGFYEKDNTQKDTQIVVVPPKRD